MSRRKADTASADCLVCGNECVLFDGEDGDDKWTHGPYTPMEDRNHTPRPDL